MLIALIGCAPPATFDTGDPDCDPVELGADEVRVKEWRCAAEAPDLGSARRGDWVLQNSEIIAVVRSPGESLTLVGEVGGTLVDLAPVGEWDRLWEAVPLGRTDAELLVGEDFVEVGGVRWTLPPDVPWIEVSGAETLHLHGDRRSVALGSDFVRSGILYGTDGVLVEDLGGAQIVSGVTRIVVGDDDLVRAELYDVPVSGTCPGTQVDVVDAQGSRVAVLPADFDTFVPDEAAGLICRAEGYTDGPVSALDAGDLALGGFGELLVRAVDERGVDMPVLVEVDGVGFPVDRREAVPTGEGTFSVRVHKGPAYTEWSGEVAVADSVELEVVLQRQVPEGWALVDLFRAPFPSLDSRVEQNEDIEVAAASGIDFVVHTPKNEVGRPYQGDWTEREARVETGSHTAGKWDIWSWPWSANDKRAGHGAVNPEGVSAADLLALANGYGDPDRITVVTPAWAAAAGNSAGWPEDPDLLKLDGSLDEYFRLLDEGLRIGVAGPLTWVPADTTELPSVRSMERPLVTGRSVATTGPLLEMRVRDGVLPGTAATVTLNREAALWADGALVGEATEFELTYERWLVAVWVDGQDWAVTSPHWKGHGPGL